MPETIELSGLPLHINGSFGLKDDRRDFKWLADDNREDQAAQWNELMVSEVLNTVLVQLLAFAKQLVESKDADLSIREFYYLLPCLQNMSRNWREKHLRSFFDNLLHEDLIFTVNRTWTKISGVLLTNRIDACITAHCKDEQAAQFLRQTVHSCFDQSLLADSEIPGHVIQLYDEVNKQSKQANQLRHVDNEMVCQALRERNVNLSSNQKCALLDFLIISLESLSSLKQL